MQITKINTCWCELHCSIISTFLLLSFLYNYGKVPWYLGEKMFKSFILYNYGSNFIQTTNGTYYFCKVWHLMVYLMCYFIVGFHSQRNYSFWRSYSVLCRDKVLVSTIWKVLYKVYIHTYYKKCNTLILSEWFQALK